MLFVYYSPFFSKIVYSNQRTSRKQKTTESVLGLLVRGVDPLLLYTTQLSYLDKLQSFHSFAAKAEDPSQNQSTTQNALYPLFDKVADRYIQPGNQFQECNC